MPFKTEQKIRNFGGYLLKLSHDSDAVKGRMNINLYLPPQAENAQHGSIPLLFWLSGLTCTPDNCADKGFFQPWAAKKGIAIVYPDTSPRQAKIEGDDDSWDFGTGAGFYVDATKDPWKKEYNMQTYVSKELPQQLFEEFKLLDSKRVSISGHSMGGHGALILFLKNPGKYKSVSAFAPICNPINCPWGQKAFVGYFGSVDQDTWKENDSTELLGHYKGKLDVLIDVGTGDKFYKQGQLLPENFDETAAHLGIRGPHYKMRFQEEYDHSYYFVSSFAEDHIEYHSQFLF
ncbi:Alpha/Beta hydrolase protein [Terfezia claveryi]|nr:Alpha/Beta hydrolase protein [Terfezia claveryi]